MNKVERNDPCHCGSGKKYKQCCLKRDEALASSKHVEIALSANAMQEAIEHHQAGRLLQAEAVYQKILLAEPDHPDALHYLGVIAHQTGRNELAVELISKALLFKTDYAEAHNNLALVLQAQGDLAAAIKSYQTALSVKPDYADAYFNLGNALRGLGNLEKAANHYSKALSLRPNHAEAHYNFGNVLKDLGKLDEAVEHYHKAIEFKPNYAEPHGNLGLVFLSQGKLDEGIEHCRIALTIKPGLAEAHNNLGAALQAQGKFDEAVEHCRQALSLKPDYAEAHNNLGNAFKDLGRLDEAVESYHHAFTLKPDYAEAYSNLGNVLKDQGRLGEAIEQYRKALSIKPANAIVHSNLLYALNFNADLSRGGVYRAAQEYEAQIGRPLRSTWRAHSNNKNPNRRLRVGYFSPDFRGHAVAYFAEPILASHDKAQVEIFCYAEVMREDEVSNRFRRLADHWYSTVGLSDDAVAQMIRDHQIDVLVDLAGHTARNRLPVFARKPAPIQITYLGYLGTTGLSAMDYLVTDRHIDPDGIADAGYTEQLLRMPDSLWCYRPGANMPDIPSLPALAHGYLTFGSFNNFNKIDQPTLDLWAAMLRALPASRLMMLAVSEGETRHRLLRHFAERGIDAHRLELHGNLPITEYRRKLLEVDITLDPVTVNGATTTCESLWMGVPVMSLVGTRFPSRAGLSILSTVGLADFAVATREDYLHLASHLADNLPLLAEIRAGLRAHIAASPLIDEAGFTRNLENLYREVWKKWCGT